jgi:hypothetical protein
MDQERAESLVIGDRRTGATGVYVVIHEDREDRRAPITRLSVRY